MTTEEFKKKFHLKTTKGLSVSHLHRSLAAPSVYFGYVRAGAPGKGDFALFNGLGHFVGWSDDHFDPTGPGDLVPRETKQESKSFTACMKPGVLDLTPFRVFNQHSVLGGRRITELTWNEEKPDELLGKLEGHVGFVFIWSTQGSVSGIIRGGRPVAFRDVALYNLKLRMIVTPTPSGSAFPGSVLGRFRDLEAYENAARASSLITGYQEAVAAVFGAPPKPVPLLEPAAPDEAKHALNVLLNHTAKPVRNQLSGEIALLRRFIREAKEGE